MQLPKFVRAKVGSGLKVLYFTKDGQTFVFSGGDPNWRNNNPGNLVPGDISKRNGAIGVGAKGFAVFPDYDSGHRALIDCLRNTYKNKDLADMVEGFAPSSDGNDTVGYLKFLRQKTGVKDDTKIKDFTAAQFEKLWRAVELKEGKRIGKITELSNKKKITRVRKNKKGTITAYYVKDMGWVSKEKGIQLARQGKIDAVVAHSRAGTVYLKTRPDKTTVNNLERMG